MDDPKIDELCQRIYKNHRQALDLIFERVGSGSSAVIASVESRVHEMGWHVFHRTSRRMLFVPPEWLQVLLPWVPWGREQRHDPRFWLRWVLAFYPTSSRLFVVVAPFDDIELRHRVIDRFVRDPDEFPFRLRRGKATDKYTRIYSHRIATWKSGEFPDPEELTPKIESALRQLAKNMHGVPDALRPIIEEWEASR